MSNSKSDWWIDGKEPYPIPVKEEDILFEFKLPAMVKFHSKSKQGRHCPWVKFNTYVTKQVKRKKGIDPQDEDAIVRSISQVFVSVRTAEELNQAVIDWLPRWKSYMKNGDKSFANAYGWASLDYGPNASDSPFIEDGKVYIRK